MKKLLRKSQKGQSLITVAVFLVALIVMLTLVIDGGNAYLKRRRAQNAADAGALAGARELCGQLASGDPFDINAVIDISKEYTETRNAASGSTIFPDYNQRNVRVDAEINFNTFFGNIINLNQMTARATARAGCFSPTYGEGVLPIVWSCRQPVPGWPSNSTSCQQQRIDEDTLNIYKQNPQTVYPEMYIVMDSESLGQDLLCQQDDPLGTLDCDFDGDGESDWLAGGSRSWIDLDGTNSSKDCPGKGGGFGELADWILNGYDCELSEHTWVPTNPGVGVAFEAAYCRWLPTSAKCSVQGITKNGLGKPLVLIPVNDAFCKDSDPRFDPLCDNRWHRIPPDSTDDLFNEGAQNQTHYHIKTFAAFYITCVRLSQNKPPGSCPGIEQAKALNPSAFTGNDYKSVEGYFLEGYFSGIGGKGDPNLDTGVYTIFLDR